MPTDQSAVSGAGSATIAPWVLREGIRASAGSGKTHNLTGQYLRALLSSTEPADMLATTFTRKAAGEILQRVMQRLSTACVSQDELNTLCHDLRLSPIECGEARAHLLRFCQSLHEVSISTIDSFFGRLLGAYRHELGLSTDARLLEQGCAEIEELRNEAIAEILDHDPAIMLELLGGLQRGNAPRSIAHDLAKRVEQAHELFESASEDAWQPCFDPPDPLGPDDLSAALARLEQFFPEGGGANLGKNVGKDIVRMRSGDWKEVLTSGIGKNIFQGMTTYGRAPIPPELAGLYQPLVNHARASVLGRYAAYSRALYRTLKLYHEAYLVERNKARVMLFGDVPRLLAGLIEERNSAETASRIDSQFDHLLLDEFQDTNPEQYAILKSFAADIQKKPDDQGLIFCVGDLKQSIYGWRGATPEIFDNIGRDLPSLQWNNNDKSWRSSSVVLGAVNQVFLGLGSNPAFVVPHTRAAAKWGDSFSEHEPAGKDKPGYAELCVSGVESSATEGPDFEDEDEAEATGFDPHLEYVASRVKQLTSTAPLASVGVLTRSNETARRLIFALYRAGVPASAEGGSPIANDPSVALILSALLFADHPSHSAARFHVLNSPLAVTVGLAGPGGRPRLAAAATIRRRLIQDGYTRTVGEWARALAPYCDERGAERLRQLVELAGKFTSRPGGRGSAFVEFVRTQKVEEPSPALVRVMTIHQAKGLEFDAVVLPELHKKLLQAPEFIYQRDPRSLRIQKIAPYPNQLLRDLEPQLSAMHEAHTARELSEALCVLYVAMTRARQCLLMILPAETKSSLSFGTILHAGLASHDSGEAGRAGEAQVLYKQGNANWYETTEKSSPAPVAPAAPPSPLPLTCAGPPRMVRKLTPSQLGRTRATAAQLLQVAGNEGRGFGTAIHSLFAQLQFAEEGWPGRDELLAAAQLTPGNTSEADRLALVTAFQQMLARPAVAEALSQPTLAPGETAQLWRERPFSVVVAGDLVSGTFDRAVLVRSAGRCIRATITDFKTEAITGSALQKITDAYLPQLNLYRAALCAMLRLQPGDVAAQLLFVSTGECINV